MVEFYIFNVHLSFVCREPILEKLKFKKREGKKGVTKSEWSLLKVRHLLKIR